MFADDNVVKAFNALQQSSYGLDSDNRGKSAQPDSIALIFRLGDFLLAIRKSVGNEKTKVNNYVMLRWMVTDMDKYVSSDGKRTGTRYDG